MPDTPLHRPVGMPFIELQTIDSTNNYALSRIHASRLTDGQDLARHGLVVFSHEQTAGKGQRGKKWASDAGSNIALSIVIDPAPLQVTQQFQLSVCTAVALKKLFDKYSGNEVTIKWPNDIYWKDRKAGGVLIESIIGSEKSGVASWDWAVVGIGLNINQTSFPHELPNPVSLKQITGKNYDTIALAKELCSLFDDAFTTLIGGGFEELYRTYVSSLYKRDKKVKMKKDNRVFETTIKSVSPTGRLVVEHGMEEEYDFGTVEWLIGEQVS